MRRAWRAAFFFATLAAPRAASADAVVVCASRDAEGVRHLADAVARALAPIAQIRSAPSGGCAVTAPDERVVVDVDGGADRAVLKARGASGRAWSPRTVVRGADGPALYREHVGAAARSLVAAALEAEAFGEPPDPSVPSTAPADPSGATPPAVEPSPLSPAAGPAPAASPSPPGAAATSPPARVESASESAAPAPSAPEADRPAPRTQRLEVLRLDGAFTVATVSSRAQTGVAGSIFWMPSAFGVGASYQYYSDLVATGPDVTFSVTRHAAAAYARAAVRPRGWAELGVSAGPVLDVWTRSTGATQAVATPPATVVDVGASVRADSTWWVVPWVGLAGAVSAEWVPGRPEFRGPSGPVLDPAPVRLRFDSGLAVALP